MTAQITIARLRNSQKRLASTSGRETGRRAPLYGRPSPRLRRSSSWRSRLAAPGSAG